MMGGRAGEPTGHPPSPNAGCTTSPADAKKFWGILGKLSTAVLVAVTADGNIEGVAVGIDMHTFSRITFQCDPPLPVKDWTVVEPAVVAEKLVGFARTQVRLTVEGGKLNALIKDGSWATGSQDGALLRTRFVMPLPEPMAMALVAPQRAYDMQRYLGTTGELVDVKFNSDSITITGRGSVRVIPCEFIKWGQGGEPGVSAEFDPRWILPPLNGPPGGAVLSMAESVNGRRFLTVMVGGGRFKCTVAVVISPGAAVMMVHRPSASTTSKNPDGIAAEMELGDARALAKMYRLQGRAG